MSDMNRFIFITIFTAALLSAATSCTSREPLSDILPKGDNAFYLEIGFGSGIIPTFLKEDTKGEDPYYSQLDMTLVGSDGKEHVFMYAGTNHKPEYQGKCIYKGSIPDAPDTYRVIYPVQDTEISSGTDTSYFAFRIPSEQTACAAHPDVYDSRALVMTGRFKMDKATRSSVVLTHRCAIVRFRVDDQTEWQKFVFRGNDGEVLAGDFAYRNSASSTSCEPLGNNQTEVTLYAEGHSLYRSYQIVVYPQTLEKGFTLEMYADKNSNTPDKVISPSNPMSLKEGIIMDIGMANAQPKIYVRTEESSVSGARWMTDMEFSWTPSHSPISGQKFDLCVYCEKRMDKLMVDDWELPVTNEYIEFNDAHYFLYRKELTLNEPCSRECEVKSSDGITLLGKIELNVCSNIPQPADILQEGHIYLLCSGDQYVSFQTDNITHKYDRSTNVSLISTPDVTCALAVEGEVDNLTGEACMYLAGINELDSYSSRLYLSKQKSIYRSSNDYTHPAYLCKNKRYKIYAMWKISDGIYAYGDNWHLVYLNDKLRDTNSTSNLITLKEFVEQ